MTLLQKLQAIAAAFDEIIAKGAQVITILTDVNTFLDQV